MPRSPALTSRAATGSSRLLAPGIQPPAFVRTEIIHVAVISGERAAYILPPMLDKELTYTASAGAKEGTVILTLDGPFTLSNIFQLQTELRTLKPACLIMDLTSVPYMDSAGLGVVMNYFVSAQGNGRKFLLVGVNERVRALLEMTKVDSVLGLCDSVEDAQSQA
jgi:anti-anti-sigma factor